MKQVPNISFQPRKLAVEKGLEILEIEELLRQRQLPKDHNPFQPHRVTFFAILFIRSVQARHQVDFSPMTVKKGECLLISKGQIHAFSDKKDYQGELLIFTETFANKYIAPACIDQVHRLFNHFVGTNRFPYAELAPSLELLKKEFHQSNQIQSGISGALLSILLLKLAHKKDQQGVPKTETGTQQKFQQFRDLLEHRVNESRDAAYYAEALGMSYKQLNETCKLAVNQTAKVFIDHFVTLEASRQLVCTSQTIKEISYGIGFDDPTNFVKYFRKQTGQTPRQFRASNL